MRTRSTAMAALVCAAVTMAACGGSKTASTTTSTTSSRPGGGAAIVVDAIDNGSTQAIAVGDTLTIALQVDSDSGDSWDITKQPDAAVLEVVSRSEEPVSTSSTTPGSPRLVGGMQVSRTVLRAKDAGKTSIELTDVPPGGGAPLDTFKIDVVVKPSGRAFAHLEQLDVQPGGVDVDRTGTVEGSAGDVYVVKSAGGAGEALNVHLTTTSGKATVTVLGSDGTTLASDSARIALQLQHSGTFRVVVATAGGKAAYKVSIGVSVPAT